MNTNMHIHTKVDRKWSGSRLESDRCSMNSNQMPFIVTLLGKTSITMFTNVGFFSSMNTNMHIHTTWILHNQRTKWTTITFRTKHNWTLQQIYWKIWIFFSIIYNFFYQKAMLKNTCPGQRNEPKSDGFCFVYVVFVLFVIIAVHRNCVIYNFSTA